jgi:hypothetical protein
VYRRSVQAHQTTKCTASGHREFTIQLANKPPIAGLENMLLNYFEATIARGTKFLPGQTIQMGWSLLRICDRSDGTLGVQERELAPDVEWVEQTDRALVDMWLQREIGDSVKLLDQLAFPRQDDVALVAECGIESNQVVMTRLGADSAKDGFSGWMLACSDEHDHGERAQLPLLGVAAMKPGLVQLFALPFDTSVLVLYREKANTPAGTLRIEPHVFRGGQEIVPDAGSYLAMLQG